MLEMQYDKFDSKSESYEQGRPTYPGSAIQFLCQEIGLSAEMTVADIGAGTGQLTRDLQRIFVNVMAVEPNDDMRSYLGSRAVKGTAEKTNLPNKSVSAIFAAQAFHWFHIEKARAEFKRILTGPCGVALLWNDREKENQPGLVELEKMMNDLRGGNPQVLGADESSIQDFFQLPKVNYAEFKNPVALSKDSFRAMVLSRSYAPRQNTTQYIVLSRQMDALFDSFSTNERFMLPYITRVYWGHL